METEIDTSRCPLCGEPNQCVMAGPEPNRDDPCWCRDETFPQALLDKVPVEARRKACICRRCVQAYHAEQGE